MSRDVTKFVALLRAAGATKSAADMTAFLEGLSESCQQELYEALRPEELKKWECDVCHKRFDRKWNCDRHVQKCHARTSKKAFSCVFTQCDGVFGSASELQGHEAVDHGIEAAAASGNKRLKVGVKHEDHLDLLLPSGQLLHMGEHGVEQRAFEGGVPAHHHHHCPDEGRPIRHGDHQDVLFENVLHCGTNLECLHVDVMDLPPASEWDDVFDL